MTGGLSAQFSQSAGTDGAAATDRTLSAAFEAVQGPERTERQTRQSNADGEFELSQKATTLGSEGSTTDDRVRRYAEMTGRAPQQVADRKEKDDRSLRTTIALRSQAELRDRIDTMRADLGRKIEQRISIVDQMIAAAQKAMAQAQSEHERLLRIREQIVQEGYWKLSAEDQAFLEKTAGRDAVEAYKRHDPKLEKARDAKNADPLSKEKAEAFEREADHSRAISQPAVEEKRVEAEKAERSVAELQAEKEKLIKLQEIVGEQKSQFDIENGKFTDRLLQKAAEKAGLEPQEFDPASNDQTQRLHDALESLAEEIGSQLTPSSSSSMESSVVIGNKDEQEVAAMVIMRP